MNQVSWRTTTVLVQNLAALLGTDKVSLYPWPSDLRPTHQVEIEVPRFEPDSARSASTEESVAALSELLGKLSCEIVAGVRAIP
jgi:uncharacterized lipoprotein YmbA